MLFLVYIIIILGFFMFKLTITLIYKISFNKFYSGRNTNNPTFIINKRIKNFNHLYVNCVTRRLVKKLNLLLKHMNKIDAILNIRQAVSFTKSQFSRNRQICKNIVYIGLWFNIIFILEVFSYYFKITLNFTYLWYLLYIILFLIVVYV